MTRSLTLQSYDPITRCWKSIDVSTDGTSSEFAEYLDRMIAECPSEPLPELTEETPIGDCCDLPDESAPSANPFSFLLPDSFLNGGDAA